VAFTVLFLPENIALKTDGAHDLLSLARQAGYLIDSQCGGQGTCGRCLMHLDCGKLIDENDCPLEFAANLPKTFFSCRAYPRSNIEVLVPPESRVGEVITSSTDYSPLLQQPPALPLIFHKINIKLPRPTLQDSCSDTDRIARELKKHPHGEIQFSGNFFSTLPDQLRQSDWHIKLHALDCENRLNILSSTGIDRSTYGWAVDIGTTTLAVALVNMENGIVVDLASSANPQISRGADVISRMIACEKKAALPSLTKAVRDKIAGLQQALLAGNHIAVDDVIAAAVSGNTTMLHLYHGVSPVNLRKDPYIPAFTSFPTIPAKDRDMICAAGAMLFTCPSVASYVGGDITAGAVAAGIDLADDVVLFVDLGTNGEIVIGNKEWALCASTSAGPCFEGGSITCGMRAERGAIYAAEWDEANKKLVPYTLRDEKARGLCGSGLFEAIAVLFKNGAIDRSGKLNKGFPGVKENAEKEWEYILNTGEDLVEDEQIVLTENDIKSFIYSKAAVYAGIETLLKEIEMGWDDIDRIVIAGALGTNIDLTAAISIGLFPDVDRGKFSALGNTSLAGARFYLLSKTIRERIDAFASRLTCIELSTASGFTDAYNAALFLPHTDSSRFPSVF
jgi:uncharacterized 2Fe-2S/4Fe-4S cluster protein (DUF4445 family)